MQCYDEIPEIMKFEESGGFDPKQVCSVANLCTSEYVHQAVADDVPLSDIEEEGNLVSAIFFNILNSAEYVHIFLQIYSHTPKSDDIRIPVIHWYYNGIHCFAYIYTVWFKIITCLYLDKPHCLNAGKDEIIKSWARERTNRSILHIDGCYLNI